MNYPIKNADDIDIETLGIPLDAEGGFTIQVKDHVHRLTGEELAAEMRDQLDIRSSLRGALLRKANKDILAGLKKGRLRLSEEAREAFDLNILIWFADKALKGEHKPYLKT
ncbi:hypothetical protein J0X12_12610 [Sneathiella sp. CAU 1612]|jgi:hypothetical protein|uniref:Uncharacterized protein n=1 Tax=Sneathiella sedimenti TaxID=2816034 RepID=A0ABS3F7W8_9PROT|nr:hypothetical protein [Sneathiella sedimenti]MBO0334464.1 hypothetical protein [Sneathiella sedimenti]